MRSWTKKKITGGNWELMNSLCEYGTPSNAYTWEQVKEEYPYSDEPLCQHIKHLLKNHEGEVVLAWRHWEYSTDPLPRDAGLWDPQLAQNKENYYSLRWVQTQQISGDEWNQYVIPHRHDLR